MSPRIWLLLGWSLAGCSTEPQPKDQAETETDTTAVPDDTAAPVDVPEPCQELRWYEDVDGDGYGNPYVMVASCTQPSGHVDNYTDCDDTDADAHPAQVWYADTDADGFGDPDAPHARCTRPLAHVTNADDCDDTDASRNPDTIWYTDADADGFGDEDAPVASCDATSADVPIAEDCDDTDPFIHPERAEVCDTIDNDCDGLVDEDDDDVDPFTKVMFYQDDDGDDYGTDVELGEYCLSYDPGALVPGDCDDTDPSVNPSMLELPDATDQNCDGDSTWHTIQDATEGFYSTAFDSDSVVLGLSGDLDGDALPELIFQEDGQGDGAGQIVVVNGTVARDFSDAGTGTQIWTGASAGDGLGGLAGTVVDDMDGDGSPDLILSAPTAEGGAGVVYLVSGSAMSGDITTVASWSWTGPDTSTAFGTPVPLGDVDGDSLVDVLVTAPTYDGAGTDRGAVWILTGASVGTSSDPTEGTSIAGSSTYWKFGSSPVNVGDTDGDGFEEILLGATGSTQDNHVDGRAYRIPVTDLVDSSFSLDDAAMVYGEATRSRLGDGNHSIGDFSGDGYADFLVRSDDTVSGYSTGTAYLFYGSASATTVQRADAADARIAHDLSATTYSGTDLWGDIVPMGDLNDDGADDFAIGAAGADLTSNYSNNGLVALFLGSPLTGDHGTLESADVLFSGIPQHSGRPLVRAGDLDGDGREDLWIGKTGGDLSMWFFPGSMFP